ATATADSGTLGIQFNDANGNLAGAAVTAGALNQGDLIINGVEIGAIAAGVEVVADGAAVPPVVGVTEPAAQAANVVKAINEKSSETGVVAFADGDAVSLRSVNG